MVHRCWSVKGDANMMHGLYNIKKRKTSFWLCYCIQDS